MKTKNILYIFSIISFVFSGSVTPVISMRFSDVTRNETLTQGSQSLGLRMEVGEGVYSGFDTDGTDFRIFVQQSFGTFGFGTNASDEPQFTIGGYYNVLENLEVSLDYVVNRLTDADGVGAGTDPFPDELRLSLGITF